MSERAASSTERSSLILASASPRRRWLLAKLEIPFRVFPVDIDERARSNETPASFAERMAREKAAAAAAASSGAWILAADTVVALEALALGKPRDTSDARAMLLRLSGRSHTVFTAVTLLRPDGALAETLLAATDVSFRALAARDVDAYVASGEPFGKAGGYAIQGEGAHLIDRISGSYTNVIGLPLAEVAACLTKWSIA